jgi:hypothetical protein
VTLRRGDSSLLISDLHNAIENRAAGCVDPDLLVKMAGHQSARQRSVHADVTGVMIDLVRTNDAIFASFTVLLFKPHPGATWYPH